MKLLAVDPGISGCGCALFDDGALEVVRYARHSRGPEYGATARASLMGLVVREAFRQHEPDEVVVEWPQVYQRGAGRTKGDPNALLLVAGAAAAVATAMDVVATNVRPAEWKGQLSKDACADRVRERLSVDEENILRAHLKALAPSLHEHVLDAVGIGLHYLGRFAPRRVYPR